MGTWVLYSFSRLRLEPLHFQTILFPMGKHDSNKLVRLWPLYWPELDIGKSKE
jgi:hypothetical protein